MIDTDKLTIKRMTSEELSYLTLSQDTLIFKKTTQFEHWLFILNFPMLKQYIKFSEPLENPAVFNVEWPFKVLVASNPGDGIGSISIGGQVQHYNFIHVSKIYANKHSPTYRLLVKAAH